MIGTIGFSQNSKLGRELPDKEYEIKFEFLHENQNLNDYILIIERSLVENTDYIIDPVRTITTMKTHFFTDSEQEYSIFHYNDELMLKIKKHKLIADFGMPVFANDEHFLYDRDEIRSLLLKDSIKYLGSMTKKRIKDFLLHKTDGKIYSLAVTICESNEQYQYQFEVEYNGYTVVPAIKATEQALISCLTKVGQDLWDNLNGYIQPSKERKYEFVEKALLLNQHTYEQEKIEIINKFI